MTSLDRATEIRDRALKHVADRIAELGPDYHPACIPIVAANVAMASMADQLLDDLTVPAALVVGHIRSLCVPPAATVNVLCPSCQHQADHGWTEGECLCGEVGR